MPRLQDPVCTPEGVLYEKETILECLLQQKKDIAKRVALWEQQEQDDKLTARPEPRPCFRRTRCLLCLLFSRNALAVCSRLSSRALTPLNPRTHRRSAARLRRSRRSWRTSTA